MIKKDNLRITVALLFLAAALALTALNNARAADDQKYKVAVQSPTGEMVVMLCVIPPLPASPKYK